MAQNKIFIPSTKTQNRSSNCRPTNKIEWNTNNQFILLFFVFHFGLEIKKKKKIMIFCFVFLRLKTDLSLYTVFGCVVSFWGQHVLYVRFEHVHHAIPRGEKKRNKWTKICYCFKCLRRSSVQFHLDAKKHFYDRAFEWMIRFFFLFVDSKSKHKHTRHQTPNRAQVVGHAQTKSN